MKALACGKLNLTLELISITDKGYHVIKSIFQEISLADAIEINKSDSDKILTLSNVPLVNSTVEKSLALFRKETGIFHPVTITIEKSIPVGGGIGGGSSDGAVTLILLNELFEHPLEGDRLLKLGEAVGKDVPYFFYGGTALVEGTGELVRKVRNLKNYFLVVVPGFYVSTKKAYSIFNKFGDFSSGRMTDTLLTQIEEKNLCGDALNDFLYNDFEITFRKTDERFIRLFDSLNKETGLSFHLTGSGSSVFRIFSDYEEGLSMKKYLEKLGFKVFLCENVIR